VLTHILIVTWPPISFKSLRLVLHTGAVAQANSRFLVASLLGMTRLWRRLHYDAAEAAPFQSKVPDGPLRAVRAWSSSMKNGSRSLSIGRNYTIGVM